MRTYTWLGALGLALAWSGSAHAQLSLLLPSTMWPRPQTPFSTQDPNRPIAVPQYLPNRTSFTLTNFFPSISTMSARPVHGGSIFPTPNQMPGFSFLSAFQARSPGNPMPVTTGW